MYMRYRQNILRKIYYIQDISKIAVGRAGPEAGAGSRAQAQAVRSRRSTIQDLSMFIETANTPIVGIDLDGRVTDWNRKLAGISGFDKAESLGKSFVDDLVVPECRGRVRAGLARTSNGAVRDQFEISLLTKTGRHIHFNMDTSCRKDRRQVHVDSQAYKQKINC